MRVINLARLNQLADLGGRTALVTGAVGYLGRTICETLAELGADLILSDTSLEGLAELQEFLEKKFKVGVTTMPANLEFQDTREELCSNIIDQFSNLNILINNAAFVGSTGLDGWAVPLMEQSVETWNRAIAVNLTAPFHLMRDLSPLMRSSTNPSIVNVCSIYSSFGPNWSLYENTSLGNPAGYAASKGGLLQLTRYMATTLAPDVRVNSVSPGGIFRQQPEDFVSQYIEKTPMKRLATEDDLRGAFAYLCSDQSSYVTGQNLLVDGGYGTW